MSTPHQPFVPPIQLSPQDFDAYWAERAAADKAAIDRLIAQHVPPTAPQDNNS